MEPYERPPSVQTEDDVVQVLVTHLDRPTIRAGETVIVRCMIAREGNLYRSEEALTVLATPSGGEVGFEGGVMTWTTVQSGVYQLKCASADRALVDPVGEALTVVGALPARWELEVPTTPCFSQTDRLELQPRVFDAYEQPVDAPIAVTIAPSEGWLGSLVTGFRFLVDGDYLVTVQVAGDHAPNAELSPVSFAVHVDATAPVVRFTSPTPGAMLLQGGTAESAVTVSGFAEDLGEIVALSVDGEAQAVGGSAHADFSVSRPSRWGLTVISATAHDACGNVGYGALPFLRSGAYHAAGTTSQPSPLIPSALSVQLSQTFVDDGNRSDLDDLASLGQAVLDGIDFDSIVAPGEIISQAAVRSDCNGPPGPTFVSVGHAAQRHPSTAQHLTLAPYVDALRFHDGALGFELRLENANVPLRVAVAVVNCTVGVPSAEQVTVDAAVGFSRLSVVGRLGADVAGGQVAASVEQFDVQVEGLYLDAECGELDWACDEITGVVAGASEGLIAAAAEGIVAEMLPPLLEGALADLTISKTLTLPAPIDLSVGVTASLEQLTFCGTNVGLPSPAACGAHNNDPGAVLLGLGARLLPGARHESIPVSARGPLLLAATAPTFSAQATSFGVGIKLDLLNQALWAAWYGGVLNQPNLRDFISALPASIEGSVEAGLPPVLMPGPAGGLELGLGGLWVEGSVDVGTLLGGEGAAPRWIDVSLTLSAVVGATVMADRAGTVMSVALTGEPTLAVQVDAIGDHAYGPLLGERLGALMTEAVPELLAGLLEKIPLPAVDLSGLAGLPAGTVLHLTDASATVQSGYVVLSGRIE